MSWEREVIGDCTLYRGDAAAVLPTLLPASIALTVTSPPYDALRTYGGHAWDFEAIARSVAQCLCPGGVLVWIVADSTVNGSETGTSFHQALYLKEVCGLHLHDTMIYQKAKPGGARGSRYAYWQGYEFMFVFSAGRPRVFHPLEDRINKRPCPRNRSGGRNPNDVLSATRYVETQPYGRRSNIWTYTTNSDIDHPAVFPLALAQDHIQSWSNSADMVLDPFMGSGTTGVACAQLQRSFIGIEIEPRYFDLACRRIDEATRQGVLFTPSRKSAPRQPALFA